VFCVCVFLVFKRAMCVDIAYMYYGTVFFTRGIFMVLCGQSLGEVHSSQYLSKYKHFHE
jgi:hypothetical protein